MSDKEDRLTKGQKLTIIATIGVVFLGTLLQLLIKTWNSPDVRYEIGSYFKLRDQAVVFCVLHNYGHETAKSVRVFTNFKTSILDLQISPFTKYTVIDGGIGKKELVIEIERIVPDTQTTIFYTTGESQKESFIEKIEYENNVAKTGKPILWLVLLVVFIYSITPLVLKFLLKKGFFGFKGFEKKQEEFYDNVDEAIKLCLKLIKKNASENDLEKEFDIKFKNVSFRKNPLKKIAKAVFDNIKIEDFKEEDKPPF